MVEVFKNCIRVRLCSSSQAWRFYGVTAMLMAMAMPLRQQIGMFSGRFGGSLPPISGDMLRNTVAMALWRPGREGTKVS